MKANSTAAVNRHWNAIKLIQLLQIRRMNPTHIHFVQKNYPSNYIIFGIQLFNGGFVSEIATCIPLSTNTVLKG